MHNDYVNGRLNLDSSARLATRPLLCALQRISSLLLLSLLLLLNGCASTPVEQVDAGAQVKDKEIDTINEKIAQSVTSNKQVGGGVAYYLGAGDLLELSVFRVKELNRKVRVNANGQVMLPLLGNVDVGGLTVFAAETLIADKLKVDYLQNPQVSLFVEEYRSQEITVMGAVGKPDVYNVNRSRSIFEMLSLAGGLSKNAGDLIRVKTRQTNTETGELESMDLLMSLNKLLAGSAPASGFRLNGGDSILVPQAGFVTVEGAVETPGSYKMVGETNVIKAVALAGGIPWTGKQDSVRVIRNASDQLEVLDIDLNKVREHPDQDIILQDGDVVSVSHSAAKRAFSGFFRTAGQILGYRIN